MSVPAPVPTLGPVFDGSEGGRMDERCVGGLSRGKSRIGRIRLRVAPVW